MGSLFKSSQIERDFFRVLGCPAYRATLLFTHYLFNIHGQLYGNRLCVIVYLQSQFDRESF